MDPAKEVSPAPLPLDAQQASALCFEQILHLLDRHRWHARVLALLLPNLIHHLPEAQASIQQRWDQAFRPWWRNLVAQMCEAPEDLAFLLGVLAGRMGRWRLAIRWFELSLQVHGAHPATACNLASAHWHLAEHRQAQHYLHRAIAMAPAHAVAPDQLERLRQWRGLCRRKLGSDSLCARLPAATSLYASPLGPQHAEPLLRLHGDRAILQWARQPPLPDLAAARRWIDEQIHAPDTLALALLHPRHGMVGLLGLARDGDAATFHYWLAPAHRRQGHGRAVLRLLRRVALRLGIRHLFSAVSRDNTGSLALLARGGYRVMDGVVEQAEPGFGLFHRRVLASARREDPQALRERLQRLLLAVDGRAVRYSPPAGLGEVGQCC